MNASLRGTGCHETKRCMKVQAKVSRFCPPETPLWEVGLRPRLVDLLFASIHR
jgi:hypothetical protein